MSDEVLKQTSSLCPNCMKRIPAEIYVDKTMGEDGKGWVMMRKYCEDCDMEFKDKISIEPEEYKLTHSIAETQLRTSTKPDPNAPGHEVLPINKGCPFDCGLCYNHKSAPCICLIDLTNRCNLRCPVCFANSGVTGYQVEPTFEEIEKIMKHFRAIRPVPPVLLQLSGGEPTLRKDLPEIIKMGHDLGFTDVMLTTNGVKMAKSIEYCRELKAAGLDAVYLSYGGIEPETHKKMYGLDLTKVKRKVLENCRAAGISGVVIVPTIVKGVNDHEIGNLMDVCAEFNDITLGLLFQPVSICGRITFEELMDMRYTSSDLKEAINKHTGGAMPQFYPLSLLSHFTRMISWVDDRPQVAFTSDADCGFATLMLLDKKENRWIGIEELVDVKGFIDWSNHCWQLVEQKKLPDKIPKLGPLSDKIFGPVHYAKDTPILSIPEFRQVYDILAGAFDRVTDFAFKKALKAYFLSGLMRYVKVDKALKIGNFDFIKKLLAVAGSPTLASAWKFFEGQDNERYVTKLVSSMHFQDAYDFDTERVSRCLVHYGIMDPSDPFRERVLEIPFCAMNTIHREGLEKQLALKDANITPNEVVQREAEKLVEQFEKQ
ncbi:MAG: radical SAM protein [Promethearchaeota archaeon]